MIITQTRYQDSLYRPCNDIEIHRFVQFHSQNYEFLQTYGINFINQQFPLYNYFKMITHKRLLFFYKLMKPQLEFLPKYPILVCAPMVDQSQLPFRLLTRKYGANLAYTPMLHSRMMITQKTYKQQNFSTCKQDRPLVAQLCGDDPDTILKAAQMLQDQVDAIDLNFGCPQGIARRGHYGSFLLSEPLLIQSIVKKLAENLKVPVFCKMRILKSEQKTMELVNKIVNAGCSLLTVHGRTKQQNKQLVGACDWNIIKKIKESVNIPVIANGGIYSYEDVERCLNETGVDGVMSAESLLENPALFSGEIHDLDDLGSQYLQFAISHSTGFSTIRAHLFKILFTGLSQNVDLRERLVKANNYEQFRAICSELQNRRTGISKQEKLGWYIRYQKKLLAKDKVEVQKIIVQQKIQEKQDLKQELPVQLQKSF